MYSVCFALCTDMKQALNEVIGMDMNFHVKSYQQLFDSLQKNVKTVDDLIRLLQDQMQKWHVFFRWENLNCGFMRQNR